MCEDDYEDDYEWDNEAMIAEVALKRNLDLLNNFERDASVARSREILMLASEWSSILVACKLKVAERDDAARLAQLEELHEHLKKEAFDKVLDAQKDNERDRSIVADVLNKITNTVSGYRWATERRGSHAWNDDRFFAVFGEALDDIMTAAEPLEKVAGDLTNGQTDRADIAAARRE